jgi:hypothetical protein
MEFANNWELSPWPDHMYEPVLKLHMRDMAGFFSGCSLDDSSFQIYYDPSIIAGRYSRPKTAEERALVVQMNEGRAPHVRDSDTEVSRRMDEPFFYSTPEEKNVFGLSAGTRYFFAKKTVIGNIMRIKANPQSGDYYGDGPTIERLRSYGYMLQGLKDSETPIISHHPKEFLLYAYRSYIKMPAINTIEANGEKRFKELRHVEICLHATVLTQIFNLRLDDYPEVEPDWHRLSSVETKP